MVATAEAELLKVLDPPIQKETTETRSLVPGKKELLDMVPSIVSPTHHSFNDENDEINRMAGKMRDLAGVAEKTTTSVTPEQENSGPHYPKADPNLTKEVIEASSAEVEAGIIEPVIKKKVAPEIERGRETY